MERHHEPTDSAISWKVHAVWAVLVLLPFLGPHVMMTIIGTGDRVGLTLALYGPAIVGIWLSGHVALHRLHRDRRAPTEPVRIS